MHSFIQVMVRLLQIILSLDVESVIFVSSFPAVCTGVSTNIAVPPRWSASCFYGRTVTGLSQVLLWGDSSDSLTSLLASILVRIMQFPAPALLGKMS